jgi:hypothetical protein
MRSILSETTDWINAENGITSNDTSNPSRVPIARITSGMTPSISGVFISRNALGTLDGVVPAEIFSGAAHA